MNSYLRGLAKHILPEPLQQSTKKNLHTMGFYTWPTKSFETWLVLLNLLYLVRPRAMVEFGSGRSTNYLGEYAFKTQANLISFEQNRSWTSKVNRTLKLAFLPDETVIHAPLCGDWYDERVVARHLAEFPEMDFLFLDGPAEFDAGRRDSDGLRRQVWPRLNRITMIVVDDVDCADCDQLAAEMAREFELKRFDIAYNASNKLAFLLGRGHTGAIEALPAPLRKLLTPAG